MNLLQQKYDEPTLNNDYFEKKQKREFQKQFNLKNSNKTNSEKSFSLSREFKVRKDGNEEMFTEAQNSKFDEENSLNNSVNSQINCSNFFTKFRSFSIQIWLRSNQN